MSGPELPPGKVRAWDLPTRLFHWALVLLVASAWLSFRYAEAVGDHTLRWHRWNGYAICVLLVWRLLWGVFGSSTARFSRFLVWPWTAARYALDVLAGRSRLFLGHNPLGSYMILLLLAALGTQAVLGLHTVEHNDLTNGPLYRTVSEATWQAMSKWHLWLFYWVILPLVAVHVAANVLYGAVKKEQLITAMVTGTKPRATYADTDEADLVAHPLLRAAALLVVAAALVFGGIVLRGGQL